MIIVDKIEPNSFHEMDRSSNIIFCIPPIDKCLEESQNPDIMSIKLTQDMNLSLGANISHSIMSIEYKPRIKILLPTGLKMNIVEPSSGNLTNIFDKIYCEYDTFFGYKDRENENLIYTIYENLNFTLYIDVIQMRKKMAPLILNKGETIADIFFSWYIQTKYPTPSIENIYLIKDLYIYQEFTKII